MHDGVCSFPSARAVSRRRGTAAAAHLPALALEPLVKALKQGGDLERRLRQLRLDRWRTHRPPRRSRRSRGEPLRLRRRPGGVTRLGPAHVLSTCLRLGGTMSWLVAFTTATSRSDPTARAARVLSLNDWLSMVGWPRPLCRAAGMLAVLVVGPPRALPWIGKRVSKPTSARSEQATCAAGTRTSLVRSAGEGPGLLRPRDCGVQRTR